MELMLDTTMRQLLDLVRSEFLENAVISTSVDYEEIADLPSFVLDGFMLQRNNRYRHIIYEHKIKDIVPPDDTIIQTRLRPKWYDLAFTGVLVTDNQHQLLTGAERLLQFIQSNPYVTITDLDGVEDIELEMHVDTRAIESGWSPNLSNVHSVEARFTLTALPIYAGVIRETPAVITREFIFKRIDGRESEEIRIIPGP